MSKPHISCRTFASLAAIALFAATIQPSRAQFDGPAQKNFVSYIADAQSVPAGRHAVLQLRFQLMQGYHVNSHTPRSPLLIPTALTLAPAAGVKAGDPEFPAGQPFAFSFAPKDKVDVYAGAFIVKLPIVAVAGSHTIDGSLKYQACDNSSCYPPRTLPVRIIFTAR